MIRILEETRKAVELGDNLKLKELSNQTIHTATTTQDPDNIAVAVIVYTLAKFIERSNYKTQKGWKTFFNNFLKCIEKATQAIKENKIQEFRRGTIEDPAYIVKVNEETINKILESPNPLRDVQKLYLQGEIVVEPQKFTSKIKFKIAKLFF